MNEIVDDSEMTAVYPIAPAAHTLANGLTGSPGSSPWPCHILR